MISHGIGNISPTKPLLQTAFALSLSAHLTAKKPKLTGKNNIQ